MKPNLGRMALLFALLFASALWGAPPYKWTASLQKNEVYLHEAVELRYVCRFKDSGNLYVIDFNPPKSTDAFRLKLLRESERIEEGIRINEFHFLLFPKEAGTLELEFPILMRKTTQASIENTVIGRDNVQELDFTDTAIKTPKVTLKVKPHGARLAGYYVMDVSASASELKAFEPLHVTVSVTGDGNMDKLQPFTLDIPGVQVFSEEPESDFELSDKGYKGKWVQRFALVSDRSYTLPGLQLEYFDTDAGVLRQIHSDPKNIAVAPAEAAENLLDAEEPEAKAREWKWSYLYYLLTFVSGFVIGKWVRFGGRTPVNEKGFAAQVKASATPKQLAVLLVMHGGARFEKIITALESEELTLSEGKKAALEALNPSY